MEHVRLDIDIISDELYDLILAEFRKQYGKDFDYTEWDFIALKEGN